VIEAPFAPPGAPSRLEGREAIRVFAPCRGVARGQATAPAAALTGIQSDGNEVTMSA
jgi:hypothetical protein